MNNVSTVWLIIAAGVLVLAFAFVMNGSMTGIPQFVLLAVLGIAELICFALLVAKAAGGRRG
ncbi:hypothetical protein GCM10022419_098440 [Nonomuraea rosea]|uniref:Uncharacterized protein n=1 Tax=Nonomuraea rosea TaxID=638574 RepID=A0ABP6Z898_9ACTN